MAVSASLSAPAPCASRTEKTPTIREVPCAAETHDEKIKTLNAAAWTLRSVDPHHALALTEEAVRLARVCPDQRGLAPSLCMRGVCAIMLSHHQEAREALEECLPMSRRTGDLSTEAHCLHSLGTVHYFLAEHAEAVEKVMASLQIREELEDWGGLGAGFNMLGNIQFALCDYEQALDWYERGLAARERAGDQHGVAASLGNIGNVYSERGDFEEAARIHQRGLDQAIRIGSTSLEISSLCNIGGDYADLGRYEEAITVCRRSVELGTRLEDWEKVAVALTSMAFALDKTERQAEALACHARALEIARANRNSKVAAHALFSIGEILTKQGAMEEARRHLAQAAALAQEIGARRTAFQASQCLSEVCKRQGDYAAALGHHETFHRLEKEVFTEEAEDRAKSLVIKMEVEHHRREAEALAEINTALQEANARLEALATTDPLTGLTNHRALVAALEAETARARREDGKCALLFIDIDYFKTINDTYGHPAGDAVLVEFAACVRACLRQQDTLGRWGGEEFLALLPGADAGEALRIGERVRAAVDAHQLAAVAGLHMTCSIGAAAAPPHDAVQEVLLQAADDALYTAKRLGRNQVRGTGDPAMNDPLFIPFAADTGSDAGLGVA